MECRALITILAVLQLVVATQHPLAVLAEKLDSDLKSLDEPLKQLTTSNLKKSLIYRLASYSQQEKDTCFPWMFRNQSSSECECSEIPNRSLLCDKTIPRTSILDCYCMTYNYDTNETELGRCAYGCGHEPDTLYYTLPDNTEELNVHSCQRFKRSSTLCGKCLPGLSPRVYSYDLGCLNCTETYMPYNWIKYIAVAYVPLTFFFFIVVILRFNGTSPLLRSIINISQGITTPIALRALFVSVKPQTEGVIRVMTSIYGIWNLDFFRTLIPPICTNLSTVKVLALDYAIGVYPLILVTLTYILISLHGRDVRIVVCLWRPFKKVFGRIKQNWDLEGSLVNAFATFFLLSYLKILNATFDLLVYTRIFILKPNDKNYTTKYALYYDPSVEYFGKDHLPFAILALFVAVLFNILPILFLIVYPMKCFQRCLNTLKIQRQRVDMFVNCYQGYYKDGTNGTRDLRWFSVSFFVLQLLFFTGFALSRSEYTYAIGGFIVVTTMFIHFFLQPYKEKFKVYNKIDGLILFILAAVLMTTTAGDQADTKANGFVDFTYTLRACILATPILYLLGVCVWWLFVEKGLYSWCTKQFRYLLSKQRPRTEHQSYNEILDFPDRVEHPQDYIVNLKRITSSPNYGAIN